MSLSLNNVLIQWFYRKETVKILEKLFFLNSSIVLINYNVFVYGSVALARTKLVNKNEPEEIPKEFPSRR